MANEWIVADPRILEGKPVIRGTRISVAFLLQILASGMSVEEVLKAYPHLSREAVLAALAYAGRALEGESVQPLPR